MGGFDQHRVEGGVDADRLSQIPAVHQVVVETQPGQPSAAHVADRMVDDGVEHSGAGERLDRDVDRVAYRREWIAAQHVEVRPGDVEPAEFGQRDAGEHRALYWSSPTWATRSQKCRLACS